MEHYEKRNGFLVNLDRRLVKDIQTGDFLHRKPGILAHILFAFIDETKKLDTKEIITRVSMTLNISENTPEFIRLRQNVLNTLLAAVKDGILERIKPEGAKSYRYFFPQGNQPGRRPTRKKG